MFITRRNLLAASAITALASAKGSRPGAQTVHVTVDARRTVGDTPKNFLGLGYEISSVSIPGLMSSQNRTYVQLVKNLGAAGTMRVGGITADYASFAPNAQAISTPKRSVVNLANIRELASMLQATGWKLIWCLNLGTGDPEQAASEAEAVAGEVEGNLLAFEIGNEPDLFNRGSSSHRPATYNYGDYLREYRKYKAVIRAKIPNAAFAGPDAATEIDWVSRFAVDEGSDLQLLTHHYYRECANASSSQDKLLHTDPKLAPLLAQLNAATAASKVPYRLCETNSFCGGGKPGVSDTFGSALWVVDFLWKLAYAGSAGVNMETGVNQLGFVSSYSPIADNSAKPEYYGLLAFAHAGSGRRVVLDTEATDVNLTAYGAIQGRRIAVTIVNKDALQAAEVNIATAHRFVSARAVRLSAPSLESKEGVTFGGTSVTA